MKSLRPLLSCLFISSLSISSLFWNICWAENLVINIENIPQKGVLNIELLKPAMKQGDARSYLQLRQPVEAGNYTKKLSVPSGTYAIRLFLDVNNNQKLDKNLFGKPTEPFGFSNNPMIRFKMPTLDKISFSVKDHQEVIITM